MSVSCLVYKAAIVNLCAGFNAYIERTRLYTHINGKQVIRQRKLSKQLTSIEELIYLQVPRIGTNSVTIVVMGFNWITDRKHFKIDSIKKTFKENNM